MEEADMPEYSDEAQEVFEKFLSFWPHITRQWHREKLERTAECEVLRSGEGRVTRDTAVAAIETAFPSFETFTLALKDPERIQRIIQSQQAVDAENPQVTVQRWDLPKVTLERSVKDVFALLTGPRPGGNTDCIIDGVLDGAKQEGCAVEKLCFSRLCITPCTGCLRCQKESPDTYCVIQDDMSYIYKRLLECDAFILGFPIYSARESCHTTVFFDRLKALSNPWEPRKFDPKKGAVVCTWGWPSPYLYRDVITTIAFLLRHFGVETSEVVSGCGFWGAYYEKGSARLDQTGMRGAQEAGRSLVSGA
jgi:multimeric flavodoxin WrbA